MNKKIIVLNEECDNFVKGTNRYIKFLDDNRNYAIFCTPNICFRNCMEENNILYATEINDEKTLLENIDNVYTLIDDNGVFKVEKGVKVINKLILLVDDNIPFHLTLPKYSYQLNDDSIKLRPFDVTYSKNCCYVAKEDEVNDVIKDIMIPVYELIPGTLSFENKIKNNIKKMVKNKKV